MNRKTFTAIFCTAIAVRLLWIWVPQFWYDENFTLIVARLPFDRMMTAIRGDVHPPLWYLIEWTFLRLFPDPLAAPAWTLRLPALLFSVLALLAFRSLLDELNIPARVQVGAMLMMTLLPMQLWYAQEARMYSLLELEALLALLFALRKQWIGLTIAATAMLYTQNYGVFYCAAIGLIIFISDVKYFRFCIARWTFSTRMLVHSFISTIDAATCMLLAAALYLPWLNVLRSQMAYIGGRYWIQQPLIGDVLYTVYKLFWQSSMPDFALISGIMVTFMAISVGIMHLTHARHPAMLTILIMAFGPLFLAWIISVIWNPVLLHRALIGSSPFLYIIVSWPVEQLLQDSQIRLQLPANVTRRSPVSLVLSHWRETVIALALIVPIMVAGIGGYYRNIPAMKNEGAVSSLQDALTYVRAHWQPGDVLYYTDDGPAVNLFPYTADLPQFGMSVCGEKSYGLVLGSLNPATRDAMGIQIRDFKDLTEFKRVWVFAPRSPLHPKCYEEQIAPFTQGDPLIVVDSNVWIFSGVWLVER